MLLRFVYEAIIGFISIILVFLLGEPGAASLAMLAFLPIIIHIKQIKFDERELQMFFKSGNYTAGVVIPAAANILKHSSLVEFNFPKEWILPLVSFIVFIHGLIGFMFLKHI